MCWWLFPIFTYIAELERQECWFSVDFCWQMQPVGKAAEVKDGKNVGIVLGEQYETYEEYERFQ